MYCLFSRIIVGFATAVLALGFPTDSQAQATASYQAVNWDKEMTLLPGAYRAGNPVQINGDFTVKTSPGTLIEGVSFQGRSGRQHWKFEGTLLRQVRVGGQLGVNGHGIDSVFEDCVFNKDSNWFVQWWSTGWSFENCIFTKKFVRDSLPPLDYSVHATRCTFYGIKLPGVGFKEDPATYLQKKHMGFEQCRFVDCEVPESFLAATVDCVFEHCRFAPKGQTKWPKETGPIKVNAFYVGLDNQTSSFLNGPLSVTFSEAPRTTGFGSTLAHTQSGGRVTLASLRLSGQFTQLGTVQKKASEIMDMAAAKPPVPAENPPPGSMPAATSTTEVRSLEEMLRTMPSNIEVITGGEPNVAGVAAANAWLARTYGGHPVAMRLTLDGTQAQDSEGYAYRASARPQGILYHGATVPASATALFRPANVLALSHVQRNADFNVRGTVRKAEFVGRGQKLVFALLVDEARVEEEAVVTQTKAPAVKPAEVTPATPTPNFFGSSGLPLTTPAAPRN